MSRRQFVLATVVVAVAGLLGGALTNWWQGTRAYAQRPTVVQASAFQLVDAKGNVRGTFMLADDRTPILALFDGDDNLRAALGMTATGPSLELRDGTSTARVSLREHEGSGEVVVHGVVDVGREDDLAIVLGALEGEAAGLLVRDRTFLGTDAEGRPHLSLSDAVHNTRLVAGEGGDGKFGLAILSKDGQPLWSEAR